MITSGVLIFLGFIFLAVKLPRRITLRLLGWPLTLDITVASLAYALHWGTYTGVMAAAVAAMLVSVLTSGCRWAFGYIQGDVYHPGHFPVEIK